MRLFILLRYELLLKSHIQYLTMYHMKKKGIITLFALVVFSLTVFVSFQKEIPGTTYYISTSGNDANSGLKPGKAWKSIEKVNEILFKPGDRILFRCGDKWEGSTGLRPQGNGSEKMPIVIGSYGEGHKPVISISSGNNNAVTLTGQSFWTISNLVVTSANHNGVAVDGAENTKVEGIIIKSITARECSPHMGQREFDHCGIRVGAHGKPGLPKGTYFENILIDSCQVEKCAVGIMIAGRGFNENVPVMPGDSISKNCHIRNSSAKDLAGDGIVIFCAADVSIERCLCVNASTYNADKKASAAIWTWNVRNAAIRYCESYGHITPGIDRNPFDADYRSYNTVIEYNYGHSSYGASILVCAPKGTNNKVVIRYNVFVNCGMDTSRESSFIKFYDCENSDQQRYIYNNTFVGSPAHFITSTKPKAYAYIYNNIFYHTTGLKYGGYLEDGMHGHNLYFNIEGIPEEPGAIFADPLFVDISKTGVGFCEGLKLKIGSPSVDKGTDLRKLPISLPSVSVVDFAGNKLFNGAGYDIGAYEL